MHGSCLEIIAVFPEVTKRYAKRFETALGQTVIPLDSVPVGMVVSRSSVRIFGAVFYYYVSLVRDHIRP